MHRDVRTRNVSDESPKKGWLSSCILDFAGVSEQSDLIAPIVAHPQNYCPNIEPPLLRFSVPSVVECDGDDEYSRVLVCLSEHDASCG